MSSHTVFYNEEGKGTIFDIRTEQLFSLWWDEINRWLNLNSALQYIYQ